jgi:hypothetical protein
MSQLDASLSGSVVIQRIRIEERHDGFGYQPMSPRRQVDTVKE